MTDWIEEQDAWFGHHVGVLLIKDASIVKRKFKFLLRPLKFGLRENVAREIIEAFR